MSYSINLLLMNELQSVYITYWYVGQAFRLSRTTFILKYAYNLNMFVNRSIDRS